MRLPGKVLGLFAITLRRFAGQTAVSVAATICATAIYGHIVSERSPIQAQPEIASARLAGGVIESRTFAYYPEHLAALDSLSRFHPLSTQRTAELAEERRVTRIASLSDAATPRHTATAEVLPLPRPVVVAQVNVLPPRRPVSAPAAEPTAASITVGANPAEPATHHARIWGVEMPRFVPTGAAVMEKLATMKDRIGGLMHVSSR
ncbi:MAG: hypothetical protein QOH65_3006 [Methylobacteriaceae bacterium]|jgi:hypothetical protein|nr:hypothetical protein [Methylobacteriaceae bacterium]